MPPSTKPYGCVICGETEPSNFYGGRKSLCKKCVGKHTKEDRIRILKPYKCDICGCEDVTNFNPGYKSRCKTCISHKKTLKRSSPRTRKIRVVVNEIPETPKPVIRTRKLLVLQ